MVILKKNPYSQCLNFKILGELAEWLNAAVLKTVEGASPSGVRIPDSPQIFKLKTCHITPYENMAFLLYFEHIPQLLTNIKIRKFQYIMIGNKSLDKFWTNFSGRFVIISIGSDLQLDYQPPKLRAMNSRNLSNCCSVR